MPHILITGASGFIGSHVLKHLLANYSSNTFHVITRKRSTTLLGSSLDRPNVKVYECDLDKIEVALAKTPPIDYLVHLAWENVSHYRDISHVTTHLQTQLSFLKKTIAFGVKNFTLSGTCFEYGLKNGQLNEELTPDPITPYGIGKDFLRRYLFLIPEISIKWLRIFYLYGPGQSASSLIPQLEDSIRQNKASFDLSPGDQLRDYLYIEKLAAYISGLAFIEGREIVNCCCGSPISVRSLVESHLEQNFHDHSIHLNFGKLPYNPSEPMAFWGDNNKMKKLLGQNFIEKLTIQ